jgi:UPF0755 protein
MSKIWKILIGVIVVITLLGGAGAFYIYSQLQPVTSEHTEKTSFIIPKGQSIIQIGRRLQEAGLIKNGLVFKFIVQQKNLNNKIQAGTFMLAPNMTPGEIATALTQGTNDIWVTVLEGWRVEEIADAFDQPDLPEFDKEEFLELAKDEEGYLFPDTYLLPRQASATMVHDLLRRTFDKKISQDLADQIESSGKELKDIVIMASLIQREAKGATQMKMVSGVLWNRIDGGIGLNVDATLQYIRGYDPIEQTWWAPPRVSDKQSTSTYNTYKYAGLPPRPIANPGADAIEAAADPTITDNLYYLHDSRGGIHYARTLDEHNRNVQMYLR